MPRPSRWLPPKNEFYEKVRDRGGTPDAEKRLRKQVVKLVEMIEAVRTLPVQHN
ncbi:hypothetical protein ABZY03_32545 [Streptomyces klenkii]|uniref:hypothetical protein n=1 Tax=Streptomyces klenkii TaxID=1420899 RepID=UPI00339FB2A9